MKLERGVRINHGKYVELKLTRKGNIVCHEYFGASTAWSIERANLRSLEVQKLLYLGQYGQEAKAETWTVEKVLDCYLEKHSSKIASYRNHKLYVTYFKQEFKNKFWHELTHEDIENYQEERLETGVAAITVRKELEMLKNAFNEVKRWIDLNILPSIKLPKQENPVSLVELASVRFDTRLLCLEEFERLQAIAPPHRRIIYETAVQTLLRRKDLMNLTDKQIVWTVPAFRGIQAKTSNTYDIPLTQRLVEEFKGRTGKLLNFVGFADGWNTDRKKAGIEGFPFRGLRRTGATWMYKDTGYLKAVSMILGHTSIQMTEKYIGVEGKDKHAAVNSVEKMLNSSKDLGVTLGVTQPEIDPILKEKK